MSTTTTPTSASPLPRSKADSGRGRRVTDAPTRLAHALMGLAFTGAWITGDSEHWRHLHVALGYVMALALVFRLVWGLVGPRHARLAGRWRAVTGLPAWLRGTGQMLRAAGENGRGGLAAVNWPALAKTAAPLAMTTLLLALLALLGPLAATGWTTYQELGGEWLAELHEGLANTSGVLVLGHLALLALLSALRRRNQALPMISGRMPGTGPDLAKRNWGWVAVVLMAAALGVGVWQLSS